MQLVDCSSFWRDVWSWPAPHFLIHQVCGVFNAIRKDDLDKSTLQALDYDRHLWMEREIKSVANVTQWDLREFLPLEAEIPLRPRVQTHPLEEANRALLDVHRGASPGAKVLLIAE